MLGVSPAITAGAVISGAYLGDKLSPLSETTILTAQMVKVIARRENSLRAFRPWELALCGLIMLGAVIGVIGLATGNIII
jgi:NhaC family Na+:H+ antiporter